MLKIQQHTILKIKKNIHMKVRLVQNVLWIHGIIHGYLMDILSIGKIIKIIYLNGKVLVLLNIATSSAFDEKYSYFTIFRDSTDVGNSDGSGFFYTFDSDGSGDVYMAGSLTHLDSPSTTSSVTYTLYGKCTSGGKARINVGSEGRSTITLMEIGA